MNKKELMLKLSGTYEDGKPKSALVFLNELWNEKAGTQETIDELPIDTPVIDIFMNDNDMFLTLGFDGEDNKELILLWDALRSFQVAKNSIDEKCVPMSIFTLLPNDEEDEVEGYISLFNPYAYYLLPNRPGGEAKNLQLVFRASDCGFYQKED